MKTKLSKELKIKMLSVLKKGDITEEDVNAICKLSGIEPQLLQIEVIDRREQVEKLTDQELDDRIVQLEKKLHS